MTIEHIIEELEHYFDSVLEQTHIGACVQWHKDHISVTFYSGQKRLHFKAEYNEQEHDFECCDYITDTMLVSDRGERFNPQSFELGYLIAKEL